MSIITGITDENIVSKVHNIAECLPENLKIHNERFSASKSLHAHFRIHDLSQEGYLYTLNV